MILIFWLVFVYKQNIYVSTRFLQRTLSSFQTQFNDKLYCPTLLFYSNNHLYSKHLFSASHSLKMSVQDDAETLFFVSNADSFEK